MTTDKMGKWGLRNIEFEPETEKALKEFIKDNPVYKEMLDSRINDLLNFPELVWASAVFDRKDSNLGEFVTYHQQIDLAGKVYRKTGVIYITHFEFHR